MSESHLAPIKEKTLAVLKLELQAAALISRRKNVISDEVKFEVNFVHFWCDSKTVINYLKTKATNFDVYIAHIANKIRRSSSIEDWYYVPTRLNVKGNFTRFAGFKNLANQLQCCKGAEILI